ARGSAERPSVAPNAASPLAGAPTAATAAKASTALPTGTVTFLFTDIEGSTQLLRHLGSVVFATVRATQRQLLRAALLEHDGHEVDSQGDSCFAVFPTAGAAVAAAVTAQRVFAAHAWPEGATVRVRMGLHSGAAQVVGDHYFGLDVHRAARIA